MPIKTWKPREIDALLADAILRLSRKKAKEDVLQIPIRYPPGSNFPVGPGMQQ